MFHRLMLSCMFWAARALHWCIQWFQPIPFPTWTQVVFRSRARARYTDGGRGYCFGHGKIGRGSVFHLQQWWSRLNSASTPSIESGHRPQGYTAQWLKRLTADQQVPGSIPGGGHGLPSWRGMTNWLIMTFWWSTLWAQSQRQSGRLQESQLTQNWIFKLSRVFVWFAKNEQKKLQKTKK